jgi:hypothetical protein
MADYTFCALNNIFKHKFEVLGWMLLKHSYGNEHDIYNYLLSLNELKEAIEHKILQTSDLDKKQDLQIMHKNVIILFNFVQNSFVKN